MSDRFLVLGSAVLGFWFLVQGSGALAQRGAAPPSQRRAATYELTDGRTINGTALNQEGADDVQLLTNEGKIRLLRKSGARYRVVTSTVDWPSYDGGQSGNRYTPLTQLNKSNVERLAPRWIYTIPTSVRLQTTPVVVDGIMYVTSANECYALDAGNGREIWRFQRPRTKGLVGNAAGGINRGVAVSGDRLFMVTDHAHLIALNRFTGDLVWDTEMADWRLNYNATAAPLIVGDLVIAGTAGGEQGVRGFLAAYRSGNRQRGVAVLDRAEAGRARIGNMGRLGH